MNGGRDRSRDRSVHFPCAKFRGNFVGRRRRRILDFSLQFLRWLKFVEMTWLNILACEDSFCYCFFSVSRR